MTLRRMTIPTALVLEALARGLRYGFEIADHVGLRPGSVYHVLRRLEDAGAVRAAWEDAGRAHAEGRPPRRYYDLVASRAGPLLAEVRRRYPHLPTADPFPSARPGSNATGSATSGAGSAGGVP